MANSTDRFDVIHWDGQGFEIRGVSRDRAERAARACDARRPANVASNGLHAKIVPVGTGRLDTTKGSLTPGGTR